jgi:hypothetical protein
MKSSKSIRNGRFHPPKCTGKVQKTREETLKGLFSNLLIPTAHLSGLMWSTLAGWLQHLPALPKLLLIFFVSPKLLILRSKNYEIGTHSKLIPRHTFTKSFKKSKNKMRSSDAVQIPFVHHMNKRSTRG